MFFKMGLGIQTAPFLGGWTPSKTETGMWLDASDSNSIVEFGGAGVVLVWNDKSGNDNSVGQSILAQRPLISDNAMVFGPNQFLERVNSSNLLDSNGEHLLLVVHKIIDPTASTADDPAIFKHQSSAASVSERRPYLQYQKSGDSLYHIDSASTGANISDVSANAGYSIIACTQSTTSNKIYLNGTLKDTYAQVPDTTTTTTESDYLQLGDLSDQNLTMEFKEIILIPKTPTTYQRTLLEGYLAHKWDLTWYLPDTHPYKYDGRKFGYSKIWSPYDITTALWLDAAESTTVTSATNAVSEWADKSGNDNHAVQTVGANKPLINTEKINNLNAILFDGTASFLNLTDDLSLKSCMVFIVYNSRVTATGFILTNAGSGGSKSRFYVYDNRCDFGNVESSTTLSENYVYLSSSVVDGTGDASTQSYYINGVLKDTDSVDRAYTEARFDIGARDGASFNSCLVGEIIVVYDDVTTATRQKIEAYLSDKWSLTDTPQYVEPPASATGTTIYVIGGYDGTVALQDTDEYVPDTWTAKTDVPTPARQGSSASAIDSKVYSYGGTDTANSTKYADTDEYNPDTWTAKTDMPSPARAFAIAETLSSKGYIIAGNSGSRIADVDEYTPDTWASKTAISPDRYDHTSGAISDKAYVTGGYRFGAIANTDEYSPDTWTAKTNNPAPTYGAGAGVLDGSMYVIAGDTGSRVQDTDEYTPDTWTAKTNMPTPARSYHGVSDADGAIYSIGGYTGGEMIDVDEYIPDTWTSKTSIPTPYRQKVGTGTV